MEELCKIRDIQRAVYQFEQSFEKIYGIGLNEGMALCSLCKAGSLSSGEIGELLGLTLSNTSKVMASIERKELVERAMGQKDKRQMYFLLTEKGKQLLATIRKTPLEIPEGLKLILQSPCFV